MKTTAFLSSVLEPWLATGITAGIALLVVSLAFSIGSRVLRRLAAPHVVLRTVLRRARESARWTLMLVAVQAAWTSAPEYLPAIGAVRHFTGLGIILGLTWLGVRCAGAVKLGVVELYPVHNTDNLEARRIQTQTGVLTRSLMFVIVLIGISSALMTFPGVRQIGTSLLASAGVAGLVVGFAARPVLGNLLAGLQIALAQPIRLDDVVIVENEWGWVEEITGTYVVVRLWDQRRMVVPLQWFIEHPFQNWTRDSAEIIGTVFLWVDYHMPLEPLRQEIKRLCEASPDWDGRVCIIQVTDASERTVQLRALVSSVNSPRNWDLRCHVREGLIDFIQREYPDYLPRVRAELRERSASAQEAVAAARVLRD